jgi:hypothetical protein
MPLPPRRFPLTCIAVAMLVVAACDRRDEIAFYDAPKEPPPPPAATQAAVMPVADTAAAGGAATSLHWDAPKDWKEMPAGQMRVAVFRANDDPPVDVTVIPLGPESGALLPNVNRWERELGIGPSPEAKLAELTKQTKVNGIDVTSVDLSGAEKRTLAAIVPFGGRVWFFKMQGPLAVVEKQKANFDAFINSIHPSEGDAHAAAPKAGVGGVNAPPAGPANPHLAVGTVSKLTKYEKPEGWTEIPNAQPPRMLALQVGEGDAKAEMIATRFAAGNTGSFADNVNRWRNQIGLQPVADPSTVPMKDAVVGKDGEGIAIELDNPDARKSMVVVIASSRGDLWFLKFTGPSDTVKSQREKFDAFVRSLEFGGDTNQ